MAEAGRGPLWLLFTIALLLGLANTTIGLGAAFFVFALWLAATWRPGAPTVLALGVLLVAAVPALLLRGQAVAAEGAGNIAFAFLLAGIAGHLAALAQNGRGAWRPIGAADFPVPADQLTPILLDWFVLCVAAIVALGSGGSGGVPATETLALPVVVAFVTLLVARPALYREDGRWPVVIGVVVLTTILWSGGQLLLGRPLPAVDVYLLFAGSAIALLLARRFLLPMRWLARRGAAVGLLTALLLLLVAGARPAADWWRANRLQPVTVDLAPALTTAEMTPGALVSVGETSGQPLVRLQAPPGAPGQLRYQLRLPENPIFHVTVRPAPESTTPVTFTVLLIDDGRTLRLWQAPDDAAGPVAVDLGRWAGEMVTLVLGIAGSGSEAANGLWLAPRIEGEGRPTAVGPSAPGR